MDTVIREYYEKQTNIYIYIYFSPTILPAGWLNKHHLLYLK